MTTDSGFDVVDGAWNDIVPTFLTLPLKAYKHRHRFHRWWKNVVHAAGLARTQVVIVGRSAVGKSVLSSRLRGESEDLFFELPDMSDRVETDVVTIGPWAKVVSVIPGQGISERDQGLERAFHEHDSLQGVIYVADWGYTPVRDDDLRQSLIQERGVATIEQLIERNLADELADFRTFCDRIAQSHSVRQRPHWLLVTVNKADLFMDRLDDARRYYHPELGSPFGKLVESLVSRVGSNNLTVRSAPVSSWDVDFEWNGKLVESRVGGTDHSRALFRAYIEALSATAGPDR